MLNINDVNLDTIIIDGIDRNDYPDFVDSYAEAACFKNGTELDELELDELSTEHCDVIQEMARETYINGF